MLMLPAVRQLGRLVIQSASGSQGLGISSNAGKPVSLKAQLRELYKLIHPDLFQDHPPAREENERSFKLLQEYLDAGRRNGNPATAALPYSFKFFLHSAAQRSLDETPQPADGVSTSQPSHAAATESLDAERMGLQCVKLLLPPPAPSPSDALSGELSRSSQRGLAQILRACGLEAELPSDDLGFGLGSVMAGRAPASLRAFLPAAAEAARQRQGAAMGPRHRLSIIRTALRLGRKVTVVFGAEALQAGAVKQAELLGTLSSALDLAKDIDLAGVQFGYDGWATDFSLDHKGTVWLPPDAGPLTLAGFLRQLDVGEVKQRQATLQQLERLEAQVAHAVGLAMIYCSPGLQLRPEYVRLLDRLQAHGIQHGPIWNERDDRTTPLCILPSAPASEASAQPQEQQETAADQSNDPRTLEERGFAVHEEVGFLAVPVDADAIGVYDWCQKHSHRITAAQHRKAIEATNMNSIRDRVERQLRLRHLQRDPTLPPEQFLSCCSRMLSNSVTLINLIESQSVRVSHSNVVSQDGSTIDIAWNFEL